MAAKRNKPFYPQLNKTNLKNEEAISNVQWLINSYSEDIPMMQGIQHCNSRKANQATSATDSIHQHSFKRVSHRIREEPEDTTCIRRDPDHCWNLWPGLVYSNVQISKINMMDQKRKSELVPLKSCGCIDVTFLPCQSPCCS